MEFTTLVEKRRSANNFLEDQPIPKEDFQKIFEMVKLAPSAFNLQHTKYIVVTDPDKKEELREAAYGQYKVHTASAVVIVLGDKNTHEHTAAINEGILFLGMVNQREYEEIVNETILFYESRGEQFQRDEAIRNASISAMMFMLSAKEYGWDTCPMIGYDTEAVRSALNIDEGYEPVLMITMGKGKEDSPRPRGYRKPVNEFVDYIE